MQKARPVVRTAQLSTDEFVGLWTAALWAVAAAVLVASFQVY